MPEIAGDAALYINPNDPSQLVHQTMQLLTNIPLKNDIVKRGGVQANKFTWNQSIVQLLKVYSKVMG
jgi:glycosyltransferase involved in cell wall biosynthesis